MLKKVKLVQVEKVKQVKPSLLNSTRNKTMSGCCIYSLSEIRVPSLKDKEKEKTKD